jgi:hypothetical protein
VGWNITNNDKKIGICVTEQLKITGFNNAKIVPQNQLIQIHYIIGKYRMKTGKLRPQHGNYKQNMLH